VHNAPFAALKVMERTGIEPVTSGLQSQSGDRRARSEPGKTACMAGPRSSITGTASLFGSRDSDPTLT
jgi:hypothetical protein